MKTKESLSSGGGKYLRSSFSVYTLTVCLCLLSPGTYAVLSVMIGAVSDRLAPDSNFMIYNNETNSTELDVDARDAERIRVAAAVTLLSGLFQVNQKIV